VVKSRSTPPDAWGIGEERAAERVWCSINTEQEGTGVYTTRAVGPLPPMKGKIELIPVRTEESKVEEKMPGLSLKIRRTHSLPRTSGKIPLRNRTIVLLLRMMDAVAGGGERPLTSENDQKDVLAGYLR